MPGRQWCSWCGLPTNKFIPSDVTKSLFFDIFRIDKKKTVYVLFENFFIYNTLTSENYFLAAMPRGMLQRDPFADSEACGFRQQRGRSPSSRDF